MTYDFTKEPAELVEYLKDKGLKLTFNYEEMMHEAHHKAFTVAKVTKLDLLSDIHTSLQEALKQGKPFSQWKDELKPTLKEKGWWGEVEVTDPKSGEVKDIYVGSRRLKTIYDTNMRVAYATGRYESQMQSDAEYLYYSSVLEQLTRPDHAKMHGTILPKTHPWWDTNYPPNGWHCKCKARAFTKKELESRGLKPSNFTPPNIADKDWAYHVGKTDRAEEIYKEKISKTKGSPLHDTIELTKKEEEKTKDKVIANRLLNEMIDEFIVKENRKHLLSAAIVGKLAQAIRSQAEEILGIDIKASDIVLEKNRLLHARPERKNGYGHAFRVEEIRQIVDVIDEARDVYVDTKETHENIIFTFEDVKDETKINIIAVDIRKTVKKFGKINSVLTLDKGTLEDFEARVRGKEVIKLK